MTRLTTSTGQSRLTPYWQTGKYYWPVCRDHHQYSMNIQTINTSSRNQRLGYSKTRRPPDKEWVSIQASWKCTSITRVGSIELVKVNRPIRSRDSSSAEVTTDDVPWSNHGRRVQTKHERATKTPSYDDHTIDRRPEFVPPFISRFLKLRATGGQLRPYYYTATNIATFST